MCVFNVSKRDGTDAHIMFKTSKLTNYQVIAFLCSWLYSRTTTLTVNMLKIAKNGRVHALYPNRLNSRFFHLLLLYDSINPHSHKRPTWFLHKSTPHTEAMCLLANRILKYFPVKNTIYKRPTLCSERSCHCPCHKAYSAGVWSGACSSLRVWLGRLSFVTTKEWISIKT